MLGVRKWKMKNIVFVFLILVFQLSTGCTDRNRAGNLEDENNTHRPVLNSGVNQKEGQISAEVVPDWLYESFLEKFDNLELAERLELIKRDDIRFSQVKMRDSDKPQIAAYLTLSHLEGYFVLFEFSDGKYREVYSQHQPVYGLQVYGGWPSQMLAFISGQGGTGYQENYFHLIAYTKDGYQELWSGLAEKEEFGQLPHYRTIGGLNVTGVNEDQLLIYSQIKHQYNQEEKDIQTPDKEEKIVELYRYDPQSETFSLILK